MRVLTTASKNSRRAIGIVACAIVGSALIVAPASADSDDIDVTKSADVTSTTAGDTVTYTVEVRGSDLIDLENPGETTDTNVSIFDDIPDHMTFVPGSASVTFNEVSAGLAVHLVPDTYAGGSGWTGPWVETNDDGDEDTGDLRAGVLTLTMRNPSGDLPELTRSVDPSGTVRSVAFSFITADFFTGANDQIIAEMSLDGGATWPYSETITGGAGVDAHSITATGVAADTITVRFRVLTTGTWGVAQAMLVSGISIAYAYDSSSTTTPIADGDALDGDGNISVGAWDVSYAETLILTYQAVVDSVIADETIADPTVPTVTTELTNNVLVTSDDDPTGEAADLTLPLVRDPDFDIDLSHNGPLQLGQPLTVTAVVSHSDASDGFPLCGAAFQANVPDYEFTLLSGDDGDGCLEYSEEWTFVHTIPNMAAAVGLFSVELGLFGEGPDDDTFASVHDLEYTVVLADTGAANTGVLVTSLAFLVSGAAVLFLAAQRRRLA